MRLQATRTSVTSAGGAGDALYRAAGGRPTLDQRFAKDKALVDKVSGNNLITFSRASSGTYVDSDGLIKTSPVNLLTYSEEFDQWNQDNVVTTTPNGEIAPDGTQTADLITVNPGGPNRVSKTVSIASGSSFTFSFYFKNVDIDQFCARVFRAGADAIINFNATTLQPTSTSPLATATVVDALNGWKRVIIEYTNSSNNGVTSVRIGGSTNNSAQAGSFYLWGAQLEEGATVNDYIPTGATISVAPRFDHDPVTGESLGLLIEEARTNLLPYSEEFENAGWTKQSGSSIDSTLVTGPDGNLSGRRLLGFDAASGQRLTEGIAITNSTLTGSIWLKGEGSNIGKNVTLTVKRSAGTLVYTNVTHTLTADWVRVDATFTQLPDSSGAIILLNRHGSNYPSEVLIYGAQFEVGSFPTSYIPTSGSTVTRSPDLCTIEGTNFSSWYNQSEGTIFSDVSPLSADSERAYVFSDGSTNQRFGQNTDYDSNYALFMRRVTTISLATATSGMPKPIKATIAYQSGSTRGVIDGVLKTLSSTTQVPNSIDQLSLGSQNFSADGYLNGHIKRLTYFPTRLPDANLQNITS